MSKFEQLLMKEMTRRQFLITIGTMIISVFGFSSLMGILTGDAPKSDSSAADYGTQNYGP